MSQLGSASLSPVEPITTENARHTSKSFLAHAKLIGILTFASRIFGLLREVVAGHFLGTKMVASAFTVAFTVPNLFRKLFGEGALSAAFIPLYAQAIKHDHVDRANEFAAASINLLCLILLGITVVGEIGLSAWLLLNRSMSVDTALTIKLTMIMLPYVLLICGGAFLSGILQVHKRFGAPAFAPVLLNVIHIAVVFFGAHLLHLSGQGNSTSADVVAKQTTLAYWLGFFVLIAGAAQVAVLAPGLKAAGFRVRIVREFWTPQVRRMLKLTIPVALGASVLQLSVLLDKGISAALMQKREGISGPLITSFHFFGHLIRYPMDEGAPARLNLAQFLYQFPLGVFAIALATAIFPGLSANALEKDKTAFKAVMRQGIEATLWEGLPASVGLILVAGPAAQLLFRHGQIGAVDAAWIASSTRWYAGAIWAFSLLQIVNRAYYALHDTITPLVMSIVNIVLNLVIEIPLLWVMGESAMAVGTLVSFIIQALVMLYLLDRRVGGLGLQASARPIAKMIVASGIMTAICLAIQASPIYPHGGTRMAWAGQLGMVMVVGGGVYLGLCKAMGVNALKNVTPRRGRA